MNEHSIPGEERNAARQTEEIGGVAARKSAHKATFSFGPFRLLADQRLLLEGEKPVRLGGRALDILIALVERAGEQISKRDLMARVWPDTVVVEANLAVHVAALRRALGDGQSGSRYIVNVPLRGYSFVAPLTLTDILGSPTPLIEATAPPHNLPARVTRLIGREEDVSRLVKQLSLHRLLTIVGAAGIGKTAVALAVADELIANYEHGVWLIDLAPVADPRLVPTALASALSLEIRSDDPLPGLIAAMSDKRMLFVLDNCEHVIEAAAALVSEMYFGNLEPSARQRTRNKSSGWPPGITKCAVSAVSVVLIDQMCRP